MKRIIYLLLLFPFICFGQVPQSMSYQAMATNSEGFEIANTQISVKVSIIEETPSGLVSFVEEHTVTTDAYGMFSINIGQGNTEDDYTAVDWSKSNFLKVELDDNMDGAYSLMGVSAFNSVPYSYMAENVLNPDELKDNLGDHTATQTLDMDSNYVSQVLAPELPLDAANKQYVDDMIGDITTGDGEIIRWEMAADEGQQVYSNNFKILYIVPNNKIVIIYHDGRSFEQNSTYGSYETNNSIYYIYHHNFMIDNYNHLSNSDDVLIAFPNDTIAIPNIASTGSNTLLKSSGFFKQYTVSETQIDDNTTSYSMVSLDEGASSSGGTITEGTGGSSSQGGYMISEVSEESLQFADAMSYCRNLNEDGYTDWYLPSINEILELYSGKSESIPPNLNNVVWTRTYNSDAGMIGYKYLSISLPDMFRNGFYPESSLNVVCVRE